MNGFKSKDIRPTYNPVYPPLGTDERYLIFRYTWVTISK